MTDYKKLSKEELEAIGRENGIELDRRLIKGKMIKQLTEHLDGLTKTIKVAASEQEPAPVSISDDVSECDSISLDELKRLGGDYGVDLSTITSKGQLISSLIKKL